MKKVRLYFNEEKEQQWINDMSREGWQFVKYSPFTLTYTFEQEQKQYTYRTDCIYGQGKDYIEFVESTGAQLVYKNMFWAYFRKDKSQGTFELYTDAASKKSYLNRLLGLYMVVCLLNLLTFVMSFPDLAEYSSARKALFIVNGLAAALLAGVAFKIIGRKKRLQKDLDIYQG
ncbi:MAG: DUF2812 domain-containing protein [Solibacillus sp.]